MVSSQMLKGILEGCVLKVVRTHKTYGYEIVERLKDAGFSNMTEGTVYPMLSRMEKNELLETMMMDSPKGPKRKYYFLSEKGKKELKAFEADWKDLETYVNGILNPKKKEDEA